MSENNSLETSDIIEVYQDNFIKEIKIIPSLIEEYNYIGISAGYPCKECNAEVISKDYDYKAMKMKIDSSKMIQLGITLANSKGEYPKDYYYHTWQFNFQFDKDEDKIAQSSINLLEKCGIDFTRLKNKGISPYLFLEYFLVCDLVLNPQVNWISYHGCYEFGYLSKLFSSEDLPDTEKEFLDLCDAFFINYYDIKLMLERIGDLQEGKNNLIQNLEIIKKGKTHQAGKDSFDIIDAFFKLKENGLLQEDMILKDKNCLFGLN